MGGFKTINRKMKYTPVHKHKVLKQNTFLFAFLFEPDTAEIVYSLPVLSENIKEFCESLITYDECISTFKTQ